MSLLDRVWVHAQCRPEALAVTEGSQVLTYGQLERCTRQVAHQLAGLPSSVAVQASPSAAAVISILGAIRSGARLLLLDGGMKPAEVARACEVAGIRHILAGAGIHPPEGLVEVAPPMEEEGTYPVELVDRSGEASILLLSSGTTGTPKVVVRPSASAEAAVSLFRSEVPIGPDDRVLGVLPFAHSFGLLFVLLNSLSGGGCLVLEPFAPRSAVRCIEAQRITVLPATPFMFRMLAETPFDPLPDLGSVRLAIAAGSALPDRIYQGFKERFGLGILQSYGSTETGPVALARPEHAGTVGLPYTGIELVFEDTGSSGPEGRSGRPLRVLSPGAAQGYLGEPEASASVFGGRGVSTGDLADLDSSGCLRILGRSRPMLSVAGKKVSPAEVEACLLNHPAVEDAVVSGVPAEDGGHRIRAKVVAEPGVTTQQLQAHVANQLAAYKVPREIQFADPADRTSLGKVRHGQ